MRDPVARCLSHFYHFYSGTVPNTSSKLDYLRGWQCTNAQFRYIRPAKGLCSIPELWSFYNLIGTVEAYHEALVIIADDLGVPLSDVLYVTAKNSSEGRFDRRGVAQRAHPPLATEPSAVQEFARGEEFRRRNHLDTMLWQTAQHRQAQIFDERPHLRRHLEEFECMEEAVLHECQPRAYQGHLSKQYLARVAKCYYDDKGCNHACVDGLVDHVPSSLSLCLRGSPPRAG